MLKLTNTYGVLSFRRYPNSLKLLPPAICKLCREIRYCSFESQQRNFILALRDTSQPNEIIRLLSEEELIKRFRNLAKLRVVNYATLDAIPLLSFHPCTVANRVEVLCEAGFLPGAITAKRLTRYLGILKLEISTLKKRRWIPENVDVMSSILKHVNLEPQFYPVEMLDESTTLLELRVAILKAFLKRKFNLTDQFIYESKINIGRLWNKSYSTINRNIYLINQEVGMPLETLGRNLYLLAINPANIETILKEVHTIGNIDILTALNARPKIMCNTRGNMKKILTLFEEFGAISKFNNSTLKLFTLSYETVKKRLDELDTIEYFSYLKNHPRVLTLIMYQPVAKKRLKTLEEVNLAPATLNTLVSTNMFERYLNEGYEMNCVRDVLQYLSNLLNCDQIEIKKRLSKHPHWKVISLVVIGRNQRFLSKYLKREDLLECLYVLLYPDERVRAEFFNLDSKPEISIFKENGRIQSKFVAPLLTYYLEKEANFTFEGVWYNDATNSEGVDAPHSLKGSDSI